MKPFQPPNLRWDDKSSSGDGGVLMPSVGKVDIFSEAFDGREVVMFALEALFFAREVVS